MYKWVEHTAELELAIAAGSEREVLTDALAALRELLDPESSAAGAGTPAGERRTFTVTASDRPALLAAWLDELVYLAEREGFIPGELVDCRLEPDRLTTIVTGGLGEPRPIVKGVTYHRLAFAPGADGYLATVVLDV